MPNRLVLVPRLLVTAGLALVLLTGDTFVRGGASTRLWLGGLTAVVCAALLLVDTQLRRGVLPVPRAVSVAALVVLSLAGVLTCLLLPNEGGVAVPLVVARVASQARVPGWLRYVLLGVCAASLVGYDLVSGGPWWGVLAWPIGVAIVFQSGLRVQSRRRQLEDAELLLAQEQALREEHVRAAATLERTRIARELHDVLAHTLSGLTVTLQATAVLLEAEGASAAAREQVGRARALAVDGLAEARTAVASLATGEDGEGRVDLRAVVERQVREHRITTAAPTDVTVSGLPAEVPAAVMGAVTGILREALTNAVRHAPGQPVHVALRSEKEVLRLVVEVDEGAAAAPAGTGGMGLDGMRQRAAEVGGELEAGPYGQGWRVRTSLPLGAEVRGG